MSLLGLIARYPRAVIVLMIGIPATAVTGVAEEVYSAGQDLKPPNPIVSVFPTATMTATATMTPLPLEPSPGPTVTMTATVTPTPSPTTIETISFPIPGPTTTVSTSPEPGPGPSPTQPPTPLPTRRGRNPAKGLDCTTTVEIDHGVLVEQPCPK